MNKIIKLNLLTACICVANQSYALEALNDQVLGSVTGQDGISITHEVSRVEIGQANWIDYSQANTAPVKLGLHDVTITPNQGNTSIQSKLDFDVGATELQSGGKGAGIQLKASISPFTAVASKIMLVCAPNCAVNEKDQNLGSLSISTVSPLEVYLATTNGLFNRNDKAHLELKLQNASLSYGQNGQNLTLKDFNFNLAADGYMYIDQNDGIVLTTKSADGKSDNFVELGRVKDQDSNVHSSRNGNATNPGVNLDIRYGKTGETAGNVMRLGASGALTNGKIMLNANQSGASSFNTVNKGVEKTTQAASGYGFTQGGGLHMAMSADFTRADAGKETVSGRAPTTFELGHTGTGSYAIEFSNLTRLNVRNSNAPGTALSTQNAYIDFGDIYINTVKTNSLGFVINDQMKALLGAASNELVYNPSASADPQTMALVAVRGMDFQAIARTARFISDNTLAVNNSASGTWGLGIPIYNMNANLGIFSKQYTNKAGVSKSGLGYDLAMSTDGYKFDSATGNAYTTSILILDGEKRTLADGTKGEEVNYYAGLRNIDSYIKANGVIGFEDKEIFVTADNLLLAAKAEIAIGQLPGSLYNCEGDCGKKIVPIDNFGRKDDVLASIAFKLDGKGELFIIPGIESADATPDTNFLSLKANFEFKPLTGSSDRGSYISLINDDVKSNGTTTESSINLNRLQGDIGLEARVHMQKDSVVLDSQVKFNRLATASNLGKAFTAELAIAPAGQMQKIADIAIPGGVMRSSLGIAPR